MEIKDTIHTRITHRNGIPGITQVIPIRIGVTGHKDFVAFCDDESPNVKKSEALLKEILSRRINAVMNYLDALLTATPRKYIIISSLAEGGDIIVTETLLKYKSPSIESPESSPVLQVILPMPENEYFKDIKREKQKDIFRSLINSAESTQEVTAISSASPEEVKRNAYKSTAEVLIKNCDILIAAWDGKESEKSAGTAATVAEARRQGKPVIHIHSLRLKEFRDHKKGMNFRNLFERLFLPGISKFRIGLLFRRFFGVNILHYEDSSITALRHLNTFNTDIEQQLWNPYFTGINSPEPAEVTREMEKSYNLFRESLSDQKAMEYFDAVFGDELKHGILPIWSKAEMLTTRFQRRYNWFRGTLVYILAASAVATGAFILLFFPHEYNLYWIEVGEAALIVLTLICSWYYDWHRKRIEYRALSERLRAATLLSIAGIIPVEVSSGTGSENVSASTSWVESIFNAFINHLQGERRKRSLEFEPLKNLLLKSWLEHQLGYYRKRAAELHYNYKLLELAGLSLFSLTILIAVLHATKSFEGEQLTATLHLLSLSFPAIGGAIGGILVHREYRRNYHRYRQMTKALQSLRFQAQEANDLDSLQNIFRTAYYLMLREQQTWFATVEVESPNPT